MNKIPLPIHLLSEIPGFSMLGQTSFGGYFKIIFAWWLNDCPELYDCPTEFQTISGMQRSDYQRYKAKIEPMVLKSFDVLRKYRQERIKANEPRMRNMQKAIAVTRQIRAAQKIARQERVAIVDKHTPVNPAPASPDFKPFHEGWNKQKPITTPKKPTSNKALLLDK